MTEQQGPAGHDHDDDHRHEDDFLIHIDKAEYRVDGPTITGAKLRAVPPTPIGPEFDLYEEVPGGEDVLIREDMVVHLRSGMHFFTAPANINPG